MVLIKNYTLLNKNLKYHLQSLHQQTNNNHLMSSSKYMGRVEPLELLRNSIINSKKIKQKGKYLEFDKDLKFPLKTPTAWLSPHTNKQYTLGAIWAFLEFKDDSECLTKVTEFQVEKINIADKDEIESYFRGKINDTKCINQQLKLQLLAKGKRDQPSGGFEQQNEIKKKQQLMPYDLKVMHYLVHTQRPTGSKTRSLRCPNQSFHFFLDILREKSEAQVQKDSQIKSKLNRIYEKKKLPIIIVPQAIQAGNISLNNIEKILKHGQYEEPKPLANSLQRKIELENTLRGKKIIFEVTNNPGLLSLADWQNVVAVFILGNKSEFATWAMRDPVEIFKKTRGFLLKYQTLSKYEGNDWNVKTIIVERNSRYLDEEIKKKVWGEIEDFLFQKI